MNTALLEDFLIFVFGAPGLLLLIWALVSRQFHGSEQAKYAMLESEEGVAAQRNSARSPLKSRLFFTTVVAIFAFVVLCPVLVFFAMRASAAPHSTGHGSSALVCPFQ